MVQQCVYKLTNMLMLGVIMFCDKIFVNVK